MQFFPFYRDRGKACEEKGHRQKWQKMSTVWIEYKEKAKENLFIE